MLTNAGGGYDNETSVFTCPVHGYYYIHFSLYIAMRTPGARDCVVEIQRDGYRVVKVSGGLRQSKEYTWRSTAVKHIIINRFRFRKSLL